MRYPLLTPERPPFTDSVWLNVMAAVAVGMFIGNWVIAPAISSTDTGERSPLRSAASERASFEAATARPDPSPYRTRTPVFEALDAPNYAATAKQRAQASLGWRRAESGAILEPEAFGALREPEAPAPSRMPRVDRHTGVRY